MTKGKQKRSIDRRALTSLLMFFSFLCLVPSGIAMHFAINVSDELFLHVAMSVHNSAALIFLVSTMAHVILNWKPMKHYMISKVNTYMTFKVEMIIAVIVVTTVILLIGAHGFFLR